MASLADRFDADISLEYSLIDRMRVRGHVMHLQNVGMLGAFFKRFRDVPWIEPRDLQKITAEFVGHVEALAHKHQIPLLQAKPGESHVDQAAAFLANVADRDRAIYCIIKVQEEASSFVSYVPKKEPNAQDRSRPTTHQPLLLFHQGSGVWRRQLDPHQQLCPVSRDGLFQRPSLRRPAIANKEVVPNA